MVNPTFEHMTAGLSRGEPVAIDEFIARYGPYLNNLVRVMVRDPRLISYPGRSVILNSVLRRAVENLPDLLMRADGDARRFEQSIAKLVRNRVIDYRREAMTLRKGGGSIHVGHTVIDQLPDSGLSPSEELIRREERERVEHAVAMLPSMDRRLFQLRRDGAGYEELATKFGLPNSEACRSKFNRIVSRLKLLLYMHPGVRSDARP
jgi:RNA polymerase sigma factor (sigma-70 family)